MSHHAPTGDGAQTPTAHDPAPPATLALFGAGGDLAKRLLMPSLYNLAHDGLLSDDFRLIGLDRGDMSEDDWKAGLRKTLQGFVTDPGAEAHMESIDDAAWSWLMSRASYHKADIADASAYEHLAKEIGKDGSAIFYLALPDKLFSRVCEGLGKAELMHEPEDGFRRVVIEKPFGEDLASAKKLNRQFGAIAREDQILRIDHFMGKEPVQSIMALRFGNRAIEPLLCAEHVACVEITAAETLGLEGRAGFYEGTGALRDMVPNHLFQLLCMAAMDAPSSLSSECIRDAKTRLLRAIPPVTRDDVVFGQYGAGERDGKKLPAYKDEKGVKDGSDTETFAALRLKVESWRWAGTPFYLRTGKRMSTRRTEIAFRFRPAPVQLWARSDGATRESADSLVLGIAPKQDVGMRLDVKRPGPGMDLATVDLRMSYEDVFGEAANVGYEALLYDAMTGERALFQRADTIEAAWAVVDPVLTGERPEVHDYATGSDGPEAANALHPDGWRELKVPEPGADEDTGGTS